MLKVGLFDELSRTGIIEKSTPATIEEIESVETAINHLLPAEVKEFYQYSNGIYGFHGCLHIYPLHSENEFCLEKATKFLNQMNGLFQGKCMCSETMVVEMPMDIG